MPELDFLALLGALRGAEVRFIVVGGIAAALNGAPVNTLDIDIVHARDSENVDKLLGVLDGLGAIYRMHAARRLKPNASHLSAAGHNNLITVHGALDILGTIGDGLGYADLLPDTIEMEIGGGVRVRVLELAKLIALKEELAGEKDLAVLPVLRRTLQEKQRHD